MDQDPSKVKSQYQVVVEGIQEMIISAEVASGERLPVEVELAERFRVSRSSLREGVRGLVAMGILETRQGSGTTVTSLDPHLLLQPLVFWAGIQAGQSSHDLHTVRRSLEVEAAVAAATCPTEEEIGRLREILDEAAPAIHANDHEAAMAADLAFHSQLAKTAHNPILSALLDAISRPTLRTRMWQSLHKEGRLEKTHDEHGAIFNAIADADPVAAHAAMYTHLAQVATDS